MQSNVGVFGVKLNTKLSEPDYVMAITFYQINVKSIVSVE